MGHAPTGLEVKEAAPALVAARKAGAPGGQGVLGDREVQMDPAVLADVTGYDAVVVVSFPGGKFAVFA